MKQRLYRRLALETLPGFGFFGNTDDLALCVPVALEASAMVLSLYGPKPEFLDLQRVLFQGPGGIEYPNYEIIKDISVTSIYRDGDHDKFLDQLRNGKSIRTKREQSPRLAINFFKPIFISKIVIFNRIDPFPNRLRFLRIEVLAANKYHTIHLNNDRSSLEQLLRTICNALGYKPRISEKSDIKTQSGIIRQRLGQCIDEHKIELTAYQLCALLPFFDKQTDKERPLSEIDTKIIAAIVLRLLSGRKNIRTRSIMPLKKFMCSPSRIASIELEINRLNKAWTGDQKRVCISKHFIHFSDLHERRSEYLLALKSLFEVFSDLQIPLMLCYGTLLGAVRNGEFLAHDDDIDLLFIDGTTSSANIEKSKTRIIHKLTEHGIRCGENWEDKTFKAYPNGMRIDIFPCWAQSGKTYMLMENMKYRAVDSNILLPLSNVKLYETSFPAPANPEAFLEDRYGQDWATPDPFHEWPWDLTSHVP